MVDSSVWVEYFRGNTTPETERLDALLEAEPVAIGDLMLTEVLQGFRSEGSFTEALGLFANLVIVELGGRVIAIEAARNYRRLRALGVTIRKTIDTIIATRCIEDGYALLYSDRDFDPFATYLGLRPVLRSFNAQA